MTSTRTKLGLAAAMAALLAATQAQAHAHLASSTPAAETTVAAPKALSLKFTEKLQPKFSGFEVTRAGAPVPVKVSVAKDRATLVGVPVQPLGAGVYHVTWHVVTADTHRMQGAYDFTVR